jgi:hypothetical protein
LISALAAALASLSSSRAAALAERNASRLAFRSSLSFLARSLRLRVATPLLAAADERFLPTDFFLAVAFFFAGGFFLIGHVSVFSCVITE